jgi:hypothetical protein
MNQTEPVRRMTLRQMLTHSEKCARDLIEHCQAALLPNISDFRDLSRPVRRRSHYPTMVAINNALHKLLEATEEATTMVDHLAEHLLVIRDHAKRERVSRL